MKLLTRARDLKRRKARERHNRFVVEGLRSVEALLSSSLAVDGLLVSSAAMADERRSAAVARARTLGIAVLEISEVELNEAADTENPQGILAVAVIPDIGLPDPLPQSGRLLVLDAVQDPGNLGTILRTAEALGVLGCIALPGTVDPWNAKVVRSSMGALFRQPVLGMDTARCVSWLHEQGFVLVAADARGAPLASLSGDQAPRRVALVLGNEGSGLSTQLDPLVDARVAIAMSEGSESLNVAVAAGILLHALRDAQERDAQEVATGRV